MPGLLIVLISAGWVLDSLVDRRLVENFDATLLLKARALVSLTEQEPYGVELELNASTLPEFSSEHGGDFFLIVDSNDTR